MNELHLTLSHLRKAYARPVLTDVNLSLTNGSYAAIVGKSGSGKSTLLNVLGLLEDFDGGSYQLNGTRIQNGVDYARLRRENIGFIFQSYNLIPTLSCRENILLPGLYGSVQQSFEELTELLQITQLLEQRVTTLSGGEKQRVAIARALMADPCLLLADEPTGNLDPVNRALILRLLAHENEKGRAIVLITHDMALAAQAHESYTLSGGTLHPGSGC